MLIKYNFGLAFLTLDFYIKTVISNFKSILSIINKDSHIASLAIFDN